MHRLFLVLSLVLFPPQDLDGLLEKADKLLEECKTSYEDARAKSSVAAFVEAGFKLEEARIKYLVLQEIGKPEQQKIAADRLRSVNQLSKLIHDGKVAISGTPAPAPDPAAKPDAPDAPAPADAKPPAEPSMPVKEVLRRLPLPEAAKQKDAEKLVRDLFKEQYAKKAPADRKALARLLLDQAGQIKDDAVTLYVVYRESLDAALQGGDQKAAFEAVEGLARTFDLDPLPAKSAALAMLVKSLKTLEEAAALADAHLKLVDEYVAVDQFEFADKTCAQAVTLAKKSGDAALVARATSRSKEVSEAKSKFQSLKRTLETLAKEPANPQANFEMGQFLCFVKGNWDLGLCFLGKGSDTVLKPLAEKELAFPPAVADRVAIADAWFDLAQKESSVLRKNQLLAHAVALYEACLPESTGLVRIRVQKRLEALKPAGPAGPALLGPTVDLLKMIDPKKDSVTGDWKLERDALTMPQGAPGKSVHWVQVPFTLPDEYDLKIVAARKAGTHDLFIHLVAPGGKTMMMHIDGSASGNKHGIQTIEGKNWEDNETTVPNLKLFVDEKPHTVMISVRKIRLTMSFDGKAIIDWKTDYSTLRGEDDLPNNKALGLASWETSFEFTQIQLATVSGQGKKIGHVR